MTLNKLFTIIQERLKTLPKKSYVVFLCKNGTDRILQKIGEEASEVIIAGKNKNRKMIISEMADLWFHLLVFLASVNITPKEIMMELDKRSEKN